MSAKRISDADLRGTTGKAYTQCEVELARELLQRRREVREYRMALRGIRWRLLNPPQVEIARERIEEALSRKAVER